MAKKKPTWQEKLNNSKGYPKVEPLTGKMAAKWGDRHIGYSGADRS